VTSLAITIPDWLNERTASVLPLPSEAERMRFVIDLALENVERREGGPFAAAVFEVQSGKILAAGVNSVLRLANPVLHAEVMAVMFATARVGSYRLESPACELVSSCEPCAMCLGATLWSGARRLVYGAPREDALGLGFEEGPVFPESYAYLRERGIAVVAGVLRDEARRPLERYRELAGPIYNG
jgi:tRNA(Arg) A34 adenosine deaminase TadA